MSADLAEVMTEAEARRLTERIRTALDRVATSWADLAERIDEAYRRRADLALGYSSWAEYSAAELKPSEGIAAEVRRELVGLLSARGMSTRAIAPAVGVSPRQAAYDRSAGVHSLHTSPEPEAIDFTTGEVLTDQRGGIEPPSSSHDVEEQESGEGSPPAPRPAQVIGLDGKTYTRPAPKERRRSIVDSAQFAAADLLRAVERIERIYEDDRYPRNREQVAEVTRGYLSRSAELINRLITA